MRAAHANLGIMAAQSIPLGEQVATADDRIVLHDVPWSQYEAMLRLRGEKSVPRITYIDGWMELMGPSRHHERIKGYIGRLVEAYALDRGMELTAYGSWTLKAKPKQAGLEADECYMVGLYQGRKVPDLAIEVVWTSGGLDKLEAYARLRVPEVWFWRDGVISVHLLRGKTYVTAARSRAIPGIDLKLLATFLDRPTLTQAVRAWRAALASSAGR